VGPAVDYPRRTTDHSPADDALASRLFALHRDEQSGAAVAERAVFQALALSSAATHEAQVVSLLVRRGQHNGRIAGIVALKRIGSPDARIALDSLRQELDDGFSAYF
jgi:hypothetical protein